MIITHFCKCLYLNSLIAFIIINFISPVGPNKVLIIIVIMYMYTSI